MTAAIAVSVVAAAVVDAAAAVVAFRTPESGMLWGLTLQIFVTIVSTPYVFAHTYLHNKTICQCQWQVTICNMIKAYKTPHLGMGASSRSFVLYVITQGFVLCAFATSSVKTMLSNYISEYVESFWKVLPQISTGNKNNKYVKLQRDKGA